MSSSRSGPCSGSWSCAGPLILLAGISGYVPDDDRPGVVVTGFVWTPLTVVVLVLAVIEVGTSVPVDVHPTRDLFRLVADPSTGGASR